MAAKLLHCLADDNPDLQKQIGCITGIFQLFDHHHIVPAPRISQKRLPPGNSNFICDNLERDSNNIHQRQSAADMRGVSDKQRISTESSRTSFSSSSSSPISSLDYKTQADASFDGIGFPETPTRSPVMNQTSASPYLGSHSLQSLELKDVVRDSMYREARGLSKERDTPRHTHLSKPVNGKQITPIDLKETLQVLAKLREAPQHYYVEAKELPRLSYEVKDGHRQSNSKDAPRFSYDASPVSFESHDTIKSPPKPKELPRHSLDSREGSWRAQSYDSKPSNLSRNFNAGGASTSVDDVSSSPQQHSASHSRPPSVVAKLMGLESLPESYMATDTKSSSSETGSTQGNDQFLKNGLIRPLRLCSSPKISLKESTSPRWKNPDMAVKPISSSRLSIEPAPWKQQDGNQSSEKLTSRAIKATARTTPNSFPSVYGEIEKRLKDLEFKQSGRDLRALKRILESMQVKGLLETRKEEQASNVVENKGENELKHSLIQHSMPVRQQRARGSHSAGSLEPPIVIMKPATLIEKTGNFDSSVFPIGGLSDSHKLLNGGVQAHDKNENASAQIAHDQSLTNSHRDASTSFSEKKENSIKTIKSAQSPPRPKQFPKENSPSSVKNSGLVSPRTQQKKLESEKQSRLPTSPSDSNKLRRHSSKQTTESGSVSRKLRPKVPNSQYIDDQISETSNSMRSLSFQWDEISLLSDSITVDSKMDIEVNSSLKSAELTDSPSPSMRAIEHLVSGSMQKKSTLRWDEDELIADLATDAPNHPNAESVLDVSVYKYDVSSPVKRILIAPKVNNAQESKENDNADQWNPADDLFANNTINREINRKKLQSIDRLIQKLRQLNSSHDETRNDYIASLCENTNPDHRYIAEILLASGLLLRALSSELLTFQHHSSGHAINPELFIVLEQTKLSSLLAKEESSLRKVAYKTLDTEKWHRKLIFDAVNEIVGAKLGSSLEPWLQHNGLTTKFVNAQKLLKELCFEVQKLQPVKPDCSLEVEWDGLKNMLREDVMHHSESWTGLPGELSGVVLDVERQIFKDLVEEIVFDEVASLPVKSGCHRKLFGN